MALRRARVDKYLARRRKQECLVVGIVHEPAQLAGDALDRHEVLLHAARNASADMPASRDAQRWR